MSLAADRPEFAPPPQRGTLRALFVALVAHALLIAALTWSVRWKREGDDDAIEAEIWSSTAQQAAQRSAVTPPPPPAPTPPPAPRPPPPPPPEAAKPPPAPPPPKAPDIALERERRQRELQEQREQEQQRQQELKRQKAAQEKREREAREREEDRKEQLEAQRRQEQQKQAEQRKAAEKAAQEKAAQEKAAQQKAAQQKASAAAEKERQANIARMMGQATGSASGTAEQNSGPRSGRGAGNGGVSAGYFGRVAALIKRNVVFDPTSVSGNPEVIVKIETSPDGTIVGTPRVVKSSGNAAWDDAAIRAIQRTEVMPRDTDGRVPSPFPEISLRPKS